MKEKEKQAFAGRLAVAGPLGVEVLAELESFKAADRYELVNELASMTFTGTRTESDGQGFVKALPLFLKEDCFKGLKPKLVAERVAALIRATRKLASESGEAAVVAEIIRLAASVSLEAKSPHIDAENVVAAARAVRPSIRALAKASQLHVMGFPEMALWSRVASIAASGELGPDEAAPLSEAIKNLFANRGTASNVVPVELRTLQRSLRQDAASATPPPSQAPAIQAEPPARAEPVPTGVGVPVASGIRPDAAPHAKAPESAPVDLLALLERAVEAARSEKEKESAATKVLAGEVAGLRERIQVLLGSLEDEQSRRRSADERVSSLMREVESRQAEVIQLRKEAEEILGKLARTEGEVDRLSEKKSQLELVVEGSKAASLKVLQKSFRDEAGPPLNDLADYVRQAVAQQLSDLGRLERSFERFNKIVSRLMLPDGTGPGKVQ